MIRQNDHHQRQRPRRGSGDTIIAPGLSPGCDRDTKIGPREGSNIGAHETTVGPLPGSGTLLGRTPGLKSGAMIVSSLPGRASRLFLGKGTRWAAILALSILAPALAVGQEPVAQPDPEPVAEATSPRGELGFTWWNDVAELLRRGNEDYKGLKFEEAETQYRDAQVRNPEQAASAFNLGLARAQRKEFGPAINAFNDALNLAGEDASLRSRSLYNMGAAHLQAAVELETGKKRPEAIEQAIASIDALNGTLRLDPANADAKHNKEQAQRLLSYFAQPPPPPQQQQDSQEGDQPQDQQQQPQDGEQQQQQPQDQDQQQEQQQQEQQQQQGEPNEKDQQEGQENPQPQEPKPEEGGTPEEKKEEDSEEKGNKEQPTQPRELTPQEAERLLNLLGDVQNLPLRKNRSSFTRPEPEKDW